MSAVVTAFDPIGTLLRDPRVWRGQDSPAPAPSPHPTGHAALDAALPYRPYAPAWRNAGVDLAQLHLLDAGPKDALWAMEQALRAGCCGAVLGWPLQADDTALRRLQVAAEAGRTPGFVFRPLAKRDAPSPAPLRLSLRAAAQGPELRVLKCRGALPPARPVSFHPYARH